jgi:hypothetical protein
MSPGVPDDDVRGAARREEMNDPVKEARSTLLLWVQTRHTPSNDELWQMHGDLEQEENCHAQRVSIMLQEVDELRKDAASVVMSVISYAVEEIEEAGKGQDERLAILKHASDVVAGEVLQ